MRKLISLLLTLVFLLAGVPTYAAYAQLKPPPGWSQGMGTAVPGQAGFFNYGAAANGSVFKGTTVLTNASLTVAGQLVTVPASMRLAANAASYAAPFIFTNPWLALAVGVAAWLGSAEISWDESSQKWMQPQRGIELYCKLTTSQRTEYNGFLAGLSGTGAYDVPHVVSETLSHENHICKYGAKQLAKQWDNTVREYQEHWADIPEQTGVTAIEKPLSKEEFERELNPLIHPDRPIPDTVPRELDIPLPIQQPVVNPNPYFDPNVLSEPWNLPRPLWVPTGDPAPSSPVTNPKTWVQPGQNVVSSPTPTDPWRVDVTPSPITKTNATPNTGAETVTPPVEDSESSTPAPETDPLCELFPDIVACAKLGAPPAATDVPNADKPLTLTKDPGWGPENGSCPQPRAVNLTFGTVYLPWDMYCQFAEGIRPLVVGLAYLGAALSFIGLGRKS